MSNAPETSQLPPITPGTVLANKYRVERIIGQGGMGIVVVARHIALDERIALKFLLPEYAKHPEASSRFLREAQAAVKIKSEHVARVTDVGTLETGSPYMVMEFLEGSDLSGILEKRGVLAIPEAIDYLVQACEAIAEAHAHGIVHRDLKPANLFLTRRPDGFPLVKVLDFGISKVMGNVDNLTRTSTAMGSALYMSPEQMQQTRGVDHRTDIYALGVSLYELLAGKQPFYAETLPQLCAEVLTGTPTPLRVARPDVPEPLAVVIERAYARDRGQRYQSVADLVVALAPWAPAASRQTIERVARMGGVPLPPFDGRASQPSVPQMGAADPAQAPQAPAPVSPGQIAVAPYRGPASSRATAAFANHATSTAGGLATTGYRTGPSRGAVFASIAFAVLAVAGLVTGIFLLRRPPSAKADAGAAAADTAPTSAPQATPAGNTTTAPPVTAAAATSASAEASAPEPPPSPSEDPSAAAPGKPKGGTAPAPRPGRPSPRDKGEPKKNPLAPPSDRQDPLAPPSDRHGT